ncbi:MAG: saccharopine dehydrogenase NADP-binding domain-containing protein [Pseudomonadota bacterium]
MQKYDVVVYGASGFTGRLVAEYIQATHPDLSWAMAGRSLAKLAAVREEMGVPDGVPLLQADIADPASINDMVGKTKVVITTVGPYLKYGEPLVAACAEAGTDYVDLCGEPPFMWSMIEKYDDVAKASGARIVHSCGYDSIPFDMGVYMLQQEAKSRFGAPFKDVKCRVRGMKGAYSGGTALSGAETTKLAKSDPDVSRRLVSPFALTPGFEGARQPAGHEASYDEDLGSWAAPFYMAIINTKNVHRSNMLMGHPYGTDFTYSEMIATGPGDAGEAAAKTIASADMDAETSHLKAGDGPDKEAREAGYYDLVFTGVSKAGERVSVTVGDDRDPGYGSTCKILTEAALCLIKDVAGAPGGVLTPAPVFGQAIIDRLRDNAGMVFEVES